MCKVRFIKLISIIICVVFFVNTSLFAALPEISKAQTLRAISTGIGTDTTLDMAKALKAGQAGRTQFHADTGTPNLLRPFKASSAGTHQGVLFDPGYVISERDGVGFDSIAAAQRSADEVLAILKSARKPLEVIAHLRGVDGPGSSLDLPEFQIKLTKQGSSAITDIPSTPTMASDFSVRISFAAMNDKEIEAIARQKELSAEDVRNSVVYIAEDYGVTKDNPYMVIGGVKLTEDNKTPNKQLDAPAYIFANLFDLKGIKIVCEEISPMARAGGMESSNAFNVALLAAASILKGANLSMADIFSKAVELENNEFRGLTGGQGHLSSMLGGVYRHTWLSGIKAEDGSLVNPYGAFSVKLLGEEDYEFIEERMALVQAGVDYKEGKPATGRTAALINNMWTDLLREQDKKGVELHSEKLGLAARYTQALKDKDMTTVVEVTNRYVDIRDELCRRWAECVLYEKKSEWLERLSPEDREVIALHDITNGASRKHIIGAIKGATGYNQSKLNIFASANLTLLYSKGISLYSDTAKGLIASARESGIAIMPLGAGGPGANMVAISSKGDDYLKKFFDSYGLEQLTNKKVADIIRGTGTLKGWMPFKIGREPIQFNGFEELGLKPPALPVPVEYNEATAKFATPASKSSSAGAGVEAAEALQQKITELTEQLRSEDSRVRYQAAFALKNIGPAAASAAPELAKALLSDENSRIRYLAAFALGHIGPAAASAAPALAEALSDKNSDIRYEAALALKNLGPAAASAVPVLAKALSDEDSSVRSQAAQVVKNIGPAAVLAVPALAKALSDKDPDVRSQSARALKNIGPAATLELLAALDNAKAAGDTAVTQKIERILDLIAPQIQNMLGNETKSSSAGKGIETAEALQQKITELTEQLRSENPDVRSQAVLALGNLGLAAVPALAKVLSDENLYIRSQSVRALGNIGPAAVLAAPELAKALFDKDSGVRSQSAQTLVNIGPAAVLAAPELVKALSDKDSGVRSQSARVLVNIGPAAALELLAALDNAKAAGDIAVAQQIERILDSIAPQIQKMLGIETKSSSAGNKLTDKQVETIKALLDKNGIDHIFSEDDPLSRLDIDNASLDLSLAKVSDIRPLEGIPLTELDLSFTEVSDINPLKGMPLTKLDLSYAEVSDTHIRDIFGDPSPKGKLTIISRNGTTRQYKRPVTKASSAGNALEDITGDGLRVLENAGQSVYFDGTLTEQDLLAAKVLGAKGQTTNLTIINNAIKDGMFNNKIDEAVENIIGQPSEENIKTLARNVYDDEICVPYIRSCAQNWLEVYRKTDGLDGYISIEVNPEFAHDIEATVEHAWKLVRAINNLPQADGRKPFTADDIKAMPYPNIMVKVPATAEAVVEYGAIEELTYLGMVPNVTLLFGEYFTVDALWAIIRGMERRVEQGLAIGHIAAVLSVFVSRINCKPGACDEQIKAAIEVAQDSDDKAAVARLSSLLGKGAIANAVVIYAAVQKVLGFKRFKKLEENGAKKPRILWASTEAKATETYMDGTSYDGLIYVRNLPLENTINTMPLKTFITSVQSKDPTTPDSLYAMSAEEAIQVIQDLLEYGNINIDSVADAQLNAGVTGFGKDYLSSLKALEGRIRDSIADGDSKSSSAGEATAEEFKQMLFALDDILISKPYADTIPENIESAFQGYQDLINKVNSSSLSADEKAELLGMGNKRKGILADVDKLRLTEPANISTGVTVVFDDRLITDERERGTFKLAIKSYNPDRVILYSDYKDDIGNIALSAKAIFITASEDRIAEAHRLQVNVENKSLQNSGALMGLCLVRYAEALISCAATRGDKGLLDKLKAMHIGFDGVGLAPDFAEQLRSGNLYHEMSLAVKGLPISTDLTSKTADRLYSLAIAAFMA